MTRRRAGGFTIVELMLASIVFSLVMVAALTGFMLIGRIFYQGVSLTQTQNTAQKIVDDVTNNISLASSVPPGNRDGDGNGYYYYCVGNVRYTYLVDDKGNPLRKVINLNQPDYSGGTQTGNFGLLRDVLPGNSPCAPPCWQSNCKSSNDVAFKNPAEMLAANMRLSSFSISPPTASQPGLYSVNVTLAYGNDTVLNNPYTSSPTCIGGTSHNQFCAVVQLGTSIYRGLHP